VATVEPLLEVDGVRVSYPVQGGVFGSGETFDAVAGVDLAVSAGEVVALVGESGCGKSTLARSIVGLVRPSAGTIRYEGRDLWQLPRRERRRLGGEIQMVFQDPYASLHPRLNVEQAVSEAWRARPERAPADRAAALRDLLERVGIAYGDRDRYPHEFSGGQRQRISIARALALSPRLLLLDEPVSALDVSIQAQILVLLKELQAEQQLAYLLISHDLDVVGQISDRVVTMYLGTVFETGPTQAVLDAPIHPYTEALLAAAPELEPEPGTRAVEARLSNEMPSPVAPPSGCRLRTRCWLAEDVCAVEVPQLVERPDGRLVACHVRNRRALT